MAPAPLHHPVRAIGYVRVSTDEQVGSGLGLAAQRAALLAEAERRGWAFELAEEDEGLSGRDLNRPVLGATLARLDRREADVLVVAKLDRLSRSVHDFSGLLDRAERRRWSIVCLDLGVDSTTPAGEMFANMVAVMSQYERRIISQRTRDALAAKKAAGVRLGRPPVLPADVVGRIVALRRDGVSFRGIAGQLHADGVPTARGGEVWHPSTVKAVCESQAAVDLA